MSMKMEIDLNEILSASISRGSIMVLTFDRVGFYYPKYEDVIKTLKGEA